MHDVLLEATPDYLCSKVAARRICDSIRRPYVVFLLRDPVDRFYSWFSFSKQNGVLDEETTISEFLDMQELDPDPSTPQHLRALESGRYSYYMDTYWRRLTGNLILVDFDALVKRPWQVTSRILANAGLAPLPQGTDFGVSNKTVMIQHPGLHKRYKKVIGWFRSEFSHTPLKGFLSKTKRFLDLSYYAVNKRTEPMQITNDHVNSKLIAYYQSNGRSYKSLVED